MLDVAIGEGPVHRFANSGPGIRGLLRHMARAGATQAVCEATGHPTSVKVVHTAVSKPPVASRTIRIGDQGAKRSHKVRSLTMSYVTRPEAGSAEIGISR